MHGALFWLILCMWKIQSVSKSVIESKCFNTVICVGYWWSIESGPWHWYVNYNYSISINIVLGEGRGMLPLSKWLGGLVLFFLCTCLLGSYTKSFVIPILYCILRNTNTIHLLWAIIWISNFIIMYLWIYTMTEKKTRKTIW